jgi:hypothetical protein
MDRHPLTSPGSLRAVALVAAVTAAIGSVGFLLYAGRDNKSILLAVGFSIWVISPYVLLFAGHLVTRRWPRAPHTLISTATLIVALASLVVYVADYVGPPRQRGAFVFVLVPPLCWIVIGIAGGAVAIRTRWNLRHQDDGMTM